MTAIHFPITLAIKDFFLSKSPFKVTYSYKLIVSFGASKEVTLSSIKSRGYILNTDPYWSLLKSIIYLAVYVSGTIRLNKRGPLAVSISGNNLFYLTFINYAKTP